MSRSSFHLRPSLAVNFQPSLVVDYMARYHGVLEELQSRAAEERVKMEGFP